MIEHDAHRPDTKPAPVKSNTTEEGSELVEEADQRFQVTRMQRLLRHERIRLLMIGIGLLAIILSAVLFLFTGSIVALFVTIVVVPLFYRCVDLYLVKSEASARRQSDDRCKGVNHKDLSRLHPVYKRTRRTYADNLYDG
jgi:hypothetical protein